MESHQTCPGVEVIVPILNASAEIRPIYACLIPALAATGSGGSILFVDDGSTDNTWAALRELAAQDNRVKLLRLSRSFGRSAAITAGLAHSQADYNFIWDGNLEDPPGSLSDILALARQGYDVVYAAPVPRTLWERMFYRTINRLSPYRVAAGGGGPCLVSARARSLYLQAGDKTRFDPETWAWIGLRQTTCTHDCPSRTPNRTKRRLTGRQSLDALVATGTGPLLILAAGVFLLWALSLVLLLLDGPVSAALAFSAGLILAAMSIVGLYVARLYHQVRRRPTYLIADVLSAARTDKTPDDEALAPCRKKILGQNRPE